MMTHSNHRPTADRPPARSNATTLHALLRAFLPLAFIACAGASAVTLHAQTHAPDSLRRGLALLHIGHCNPDCFADTLYGSPGIAADGAPVVLPRLILWGQPDPALLNNPATHDSILACLGPVPLAQRRAATIISYPAWGSLAGSVAFGRYNTNDTLADMLLTVRGTVEEQQGSSVVLRDTVRCLFLFGGVLDTIDAIDLGTVTAVLGDPTPRATPFAAYVARPGIELAAPAARDLSGRMSYEIPPIILTDAPPDTTQHNTAHQGAPNALALRVFPNPAATAATITMFAMPAGAYLVEIVGADGAAVLRQDVRLDAPGDLLRTVDVARLPSGYYMARITGDGRLLIARPIIVTR